MINALMSIPGCLGEAADALVHRYAAGMSLIFNRLVRDSGTRARSLRHILSMDGFRRMAAIAASIETRRSLGGAAACVGGLAAGVTGLSAVEERAFEQSQAYAWRLKAEALIAEAPRSTPGEHRLSKDAVLRAVSWVGAEDDGARTTTSSPALFGPGARFDAALVVEAASRAETLDCLARAIYYEARSEPIRGQMAVAEVVMNRVASRHYPDDVCGVVYQGTNRSTGYSIYGTRASCQFSFTCDGSERRGPTGREWLMAKAIAAHTTMGMARPLTASATHYHATYVSPYWAPTLVRTRAIGLHVFYRLPQGGERVRLHDVSAEPTARRARFETVSAPRVAREAAERFVGPVPVTTTQGATGNRVRATLRGPERV